MEIQQQQQQQQRYGVQAPDTRSWVILQNVHQIDSSPQRILRAIVPPPKQTLLGGKLFQQLQVTPKYIQATQNHGDCSNENPSSVPFHAMERTFQLTHCRSWLPIVIYIMCYDGCLYVDRVLKKCWSLELSFICHCKQKTEK